MDEPLIGALQTGGLGFSKLPEMKPLKGEKVKKLVQKFESLAETGKGKPIKGAIQRKPTKESRVALKKLYPDKKDAPLTRPSAAFSKKATLRTIFHRIKNSSPRKLKNLLQNLRAEFSIKNLFFLIPFSDIVTNTNDTILKIIELHKKHQLSSKKVVRILFRQAVIDTPLARDLLTLAQASVFLAKNIGELAGTLAPTVLQSLRIALITLGSAASFLSILFGGIQLSRGIKGLVDARKKFKLVHDELAAFNKEPKTSSTAWLLKDLHISTAEKTAHQEMAKAILRTAIGSVITAGGVVGITAVFMAGVPALGVAAASIALGCIATLIEVVYKIREKKNEKKRRELFVAALPDIKKAAEQQSLWQDLSEKLGLKKDTPKEKRDEVLMKYCFGESNQTVAPVNKSLPKETLLFSSKMRPQTA